MFVKQLKKAGLNSKEAKVYLALIRLGQTTIQGLALETLLPRTSLYYTIERLKNKGFVFEEIKNKKRYFLARNPSFLKKVAEEKISEAEQFSYSLQKIIGSLKKTAKKSSSFARVKFFEGKESVWEVFEIILYSRQDSLWFGFGKKFIENFDFNSFLEDFTKRRRQLGRTKSYNILPTFGEIKKIAQREETDFQEFKLLDENQDFNAGICIFGNKIAIFSREKKLSATIIEGKAIADLVKAMFFMIWEKIQRSH
jgi:sugar-specific transcriptional regulator TrmB